MDTQTIFNEISSLRRGQQFGREKPHKLIMLLAVIGLFDEGLVSENKIVFGEQLTRLFEREFRRFSSAGDWCQPAPPFFHLRTSSFWKHKVIEGREGDYAAIVTSGGGTKRIVENIEFAYLSDELYAVVIDEDARKELRAFIEEQLKPDKLGTAFHEKFPISRNGLSQIVSASSTVEIGEKATFSSLRAGTSLGTNQVKSMRRYVVGAGLTSSDGEETGFGKLVLKYDPTISSRVKQWIIHYHLVAPHGVGPEFWARLFLELRPGETINRDWATSRIEECLADTALAKTTVESTSSIFLGSYALGEGLADLGILSIDSNREYVVREPVAPSLGVISYAVADYWDGTLAGRQSVNLECLTGHNGLAGLLMMHSGDMNEALKEMQSQGLIELQRRVPPYQVYRLWKSTEELLDRVYES
jgi:hypothetical protein